MTIPTREEALKALDKLSSDYDLAGGWSPDPMPLLATLRSYIESHTDTALTEALTRVEELERAIQTHFEALDRHDKSNDGFGKSRETYAEVMGTLHVLRQATLSKGIAE